MHFIGNARESGKPRLAHRRNIDSWPAEIHLIPRKPKKHHRSLPKLVDRHPVFGTKHQSPISRYFSPRKTEDSVRIFGAMDPILQ